MNESSLPSRLRAGTAHLTREGILFAGSYYSCPLAIREGWFQPEREHADERIAIAYAEETYPPEELVLISMKADGDEPAVARRIWRTSIEDSERLAYQKRFRTMKVTRERLSSGRKR
ncbi:hypothetical protein [Gorillibacterium timonense]|uniref:hypothetical protein n=1 Tax=Gorillibacterium timonense TaxID=1689269 RepID=UPI00071DBA9F|nr:hypothetical protein [Gorillibacterium timonense]